MNVTKKIFFFPYHNDLKVIYPYKDRLDSYEIVGFSSFCEDHSLVHELNQLYGLEEKDLDTLLDECDAVVILDDNRDLRLEKYYEVCDLALSRGVELIVSPIAEAQLDMTQYEGRYTRLHKGPKQEENILPMFASYRPNALRSIDVPVISVLGPGKCCGKFECQLFTAAIIGENYRTIVIASNPLGALFGFYTMPDFLFDAISFEKKVFAFNCYTKMISDNDKADAIILGIPEGVTYANKREFNHFSEYPLVISAAVSVDVALFSTYFVHGKIADAGAESIIAYCSDRFDIPVAAICISNVHYETPAEEFEPIIYEPLGQEYLNSHHPDLSQLSTPVFCMTDVELAKRTVLQAIKSLQENLNVI